MAHGRKRRWAGWTLICLGIVVLGITLTSRWYGARINLSSSWFVLVERGGFRTFRDGPNHQSDWQRSHVKPLDPPATLWRSSSFENGYLERVANFELFGIYRYDAQGASSSWSDPATLWLVVVMLWPISLTALASGAPLFLSGRRAKRRARKNQCLACGYNLAGLASDAGCPECGKPKR